MKIASAIVLSLAIYLVTMVDDVEALSLVQECRGLEERDKSNFTLQILNAKEYADRLEVIGKAH